MPAASSSKHTHHRECTSQAGLEVHAHAPAGGAAPDPAPTQRLARQEPQSTYACTKASANLQAALHELLRLRALVEQAVAQDERVPQLQLLEEPHRGAHQAGPHQLLAQLAPQRGAQREARPERVPAVCPQGFVPLSLHTSWAVSPTPDTAWCNAEPRKIEPL